MKLPFALPDCIAEHRTWQLGTLRMLAVDDGEGNGIHASLLLKQMSIAVQYKKSGGEAVRAVLEAHVQPQGEKKY